VGVAVILPVIVTLARVKGDFMELEIIKGFAIISIVALCVSVSRWIIDTFKSFTSLNAD